MVDSMSCRKPLICFYLGFLELARPINCLIAAAATYIGYWLLARPDARALLAFISVFFICAGGNTINDYFDRKIDFRNKPHRPIPSGRMKPGHALFYSIIHFAVGLFVALRINQYAFSIALVSSILLVLYSWLLKSWKLLGNVVVSLLVASVFLFSEAAAGTRGVTTVLAYCAFLLNMAREVVKDIEDIRAREWNTLPKLLGRKGAAFVAMLLIALTMLVSVTAIISMRHSVPFFAIMIMAYSFFVKSMLMLFRQNCQSAMSAQNLIKIGMVLVLLAFVAEKII